MSMRSRKEGQRRPGVVKMAAVLTGTLMVYLFATAIPAAANPATCVVNAGLATELDFTLGVDERATLAVSDGTAAFSAIAAGIYVFTVQNPATGLYPAWTSCGAGATVAALSWVNVVGTGAGQESVTLFRPDAASAEAITVDLGNGTDSLIVDFGGFLSPPYTAAFADPGTADYPDLGTSAGGALVMDIDTGGAVTADILVANAENVTINGGNGVDRFDAGNDWDIAAKDLIASPVIGDNIPAATSPWSASLTANGQAGNDTLDSGNGNDTFNGGPDTDTVTYSDPAGGAPDNGFTAASAVIVDLTLGTATGMGNDVLTDVQNAVGSDNNDTLTGNALDNGLTGGLGDDVIDGAAGDDTVTGGLGDDTFNEGAAANGADTLTGGAGGPEVNGDTLNYGDRTTAIVITAGGGAVSGASGELDTIVSGFENYITGTGNDTLTGDGGAEFFNPGTGLNTVVGGAGIDDLDLSSLTGPAAIVLSGGAGTATVGTTVDTYSGIETFTGTAEGDTLTWDGTGVLLTFNGGTGVDLVDASSATGAVVIVLPVTTENATGGAGGDTITGNILNNRLIGNAGADVINGLAGNDRIEGGVGNDALNTGAGNTGADTLVYTHADAGMDIDNQLGFATGGDGSDSIGFFAIIRGSDFGDTMRAGQNSVNVNQRLYGRGGADDLVGSNSSDLISGGSGNDTIRAASGDDDLWGGAGADLLVGGSGFDFGRGGNGNDSCRGVERERSC